MGSALIHFLRCGPHRTGCMRVALWARRSVSPPRRPHWEQRSEATLLPDSPTSLAFVSVAATSWSGEQGRGQEKHSLFTAGWERAPQPTRYTLPFTSCHCWTGLCPGQGPALPLTCPGTWPGHCLSCPASFSIKWGDSHRILGRRRGVHIHGGLRTVVGACELIC